MNDLNIEQIEKMKVTELKNICKKLKIKNYSKMLKNELINILSTEEYINKIFINENDVTEKIETKIETKEEIKEIVNNPTISNDLTTNKDKIITFGKYKGKTFNYVIKNDLKYCEWCLSCEDSSHHGMNDFKNYLNNTDILIEIPTTTLNCTVLSKYYRFSNNFITLIQNFKINDIDYSECAQQKKDLLLGLPASDYGTYMDYLIRYNISKLLNKPFYDERCSRWTNELIFNENDNEEDIQIKIQNNLNLKKGIWDINNEIEIENITSIIKNSYDKLVNLSGNENDVLNVSISHSLSFGRGDIAKQYLNYFNNHNINILDATSKVETYIRQKIFDKNTIIQNPTLGNSELKIGADADLIIEDELIDIKCSKFMYGSNIKDFIQLFIYASLYYFKTGIQLRKITIYNPIKSYEKCILIDDVEIYEKIIKMLKDRVKLNNSPKEIKIVDYGPIIIDKTINSELKKCNHLCSISSLEKCCHCMDIRSFFSKNNDYPIYIDGVGWKNGGNRTSGYCPICKY